MNNHIESSLPAEIFESTSVERSTPPLSPPVRTILSEHSDSPRNFLMKLAEFTLETVVHEVDHSLAEAERQVKEYEEKNKKRSHST